MGGILADVTYVFAHPFRLAGNHFAVVDDAEEREFAQEIAIMASTRPGERALVPDFGITDPTFGTLDVAEVNRCLALYGPAGVAVTGIAIEVVDQSTQQTTLSFDSAPVQPTGDVVYS